jgi:hypothetical protein
MDHSQHIQDVVFEQLVQKLEEAAAEIRALQSESHLIRGDIRELHERLGDKPQFGKVLSLKDAWPLLGYRNYSQCLYMIRCGHYRSGIEAIDRRAPGTTKASWYLNIDACNKRDLVAPHKRQPGKVVS